MVFTAEFQRIKITAFDIFHMCIFFSNSCYGTDYETLWTISFFNWRLSLLWILLFISCSVREGNRNSEEWKTCPFYATSQIWRYPGLLRYETLFTSQNWRYPGLIKIGKTFTLSIYYLSVVSFSISLLMSWVFLYLSHAIFFRWWLTDIWRVLFLPLNHFLSLCVNTFIRRYVYSIVTFWQE